MSADETPQPDPPETIQRRISIQLGVIARQLVQRFDQNVERLGVSRAKFRAIAIAARHPGVTQRTIAEKLEVTEVTAGRLIERLCADGYMERRDNANDRRAHCVYLTAAAEPVLKRLRILAASQEHETFAGFSDAELELLSTMLERITDNITHSRARPLTADPNVRPSRANEAAIN